MEVWIGSSGFSYKAWKGPFYPEDLPDKEMLRYYGTRLPAVELDNTFYRMPKRAVLEGWSAQTPESFRFTLKASRRITHFARLKDADEPMSFLMNNVRILGEKLGCVLFQLPPFLQKDVARLEAFLPLIPEDVPAAFEFRHKSWFDEEVMSCLRSRRVALCLADTEKTELETLDQTADWGYLRLRKQGYDEVELSDWAARIRDTGWEKAFIFFKHEEAGVGPLLGEQLLRVLR